MIFPALLALSYYEVEARLIENRLLAFLVVMAIVVGPTNLINGGKWLIAQGRAWLAGAVAPKAKRGRRAKS